MRPRHSFFWKKENAHPPQINYQNEIEGLRGRFAPFLTDQDLFLSSAAEGINVLLNTWEAFSFRDRNFIDYSSNATCEEFNSSILSLIKTCEGELELIAQLDSVVDERVGGRLRRRLNLIRLNFVRDIGNFSAAALQETKQMFDLAARMREHTDYPNFFSDLLRTRKMIALWGVQDLNSAAGNDAFVFLNRLALNLIITAIALYVTFMFVTSFPSASFLIVLAVGVMVGTLLGATLINIPFSPSRKISNLVEKFEEAVTNLLETGSNNLIIARKEIEDGASLSRRVAITA